MPQSRRELLKASLAGVVALGNRSVDAAVGGQSPSVAAATRLNGPLFFDVETSLGVVRGMANTGVKMFRGIPYGADTGGKNRYMPPRKPAPWTGARNSIGYGPISPQTASVFSCFRGCLCSDAATLI